MVFALPPHTIFTMLDISLPKLLLGSKESDPAAWRVLSDLARGKTNRPQRKTIETFGNLMVARFAKGHPASDFLAVVEGMPEGRPWESGIRAWSAGRSAAIGKQIEVDFFGTEAVHLERIADAARRCAKSGELQAAFDHASTWELCRLPCLQWIMGNIDCCGSLERFAATALPLTIVSTLYLMTCWEVDFFTNEELPLAARLLPEQRGEKLIRPMRRWLEAIQAANNLPTARALSNLLLAPRSKDEDVETLHRLFRKWWQTGEIPPWSRVPHIVSSLVADHGEIRREEINDKVHMGMVVVRLLDGLLTASILIRDLHLPDYDPLAPFRDYPLMAAIAQEKKAAPSPA